MEQQQEQTLAHEGEISPAEKPVNHLPLTPTDSPSEPVTMPFVSAPVVAEVTDTQGLVRELAEKLGESSEQITVHRDLSTLLERMKDGVIVQLSISRPRFLKKLSLEDLGLKINQDLATSEDALRVMTDYFQLGRRSVLPRKWQDRLANTENSARYCLKRHSLKSHWGAFIPVRAYPLWKAENADLEREFWQLRDDILTNYEMICEEVLTDYRLLTEDAWRRILVSSTLKDPRTVEEKMVTQLVERLHAGEGKDAFVESYLTVIRRTLPTRIEIEEAFGYHIEIGVIPLPSLLAQDMQQADHVYQERALRDARVRAELDALERQREVEMRKLSAQEQEEREQRYLRLRAEQERLRLQQEMERDVLANARAEKERLMREFYAGVVTQINELIRDVTGNVLESLDEHEGILRGPVSNQLRNLVTQLDRLNFMDDRTLMQQIERIQSVLPTQQESEQARKGLARIDTSQMQRVIRQVHDAANEVLISLETAAGQRKPRSGETPLDNGHLIEPGARKTRPTAASIKTSRTRSAVKPRRTHHEKEE